MLDVVTRILAAGQILSAASKHTCESSGHQNRAIEFVFCRAIACRRPQQTNALVRRQGNK